jgi:hypothetical protein
MTMNSVEQVEELCSTGLNWNRASTGSGTVHRGYYSPGKYQGLHSLHHVCLSVADTCLRGAAQSTQCPVILRSMGRAFWGMCVQHFHFLNPTPIFGRVKSSILHGAWRFLFFPKFSLLKLEYGKTFISIVGILFNEK